MKIDKCCKEKEYKKININIKVNGKFINIGKQSICKSCYVELLGDKAM